MQRIGIALVAALALVGCSAAPEPTPSAPESSPLVSDAPEGGVLLSSLGYVNAPEMFSVPLHASITDRIDSYNNVTAVFSSPSGQDIAAYLRENLASMGFTITADKNQSMLFTNGHWQGAFTTSDSFAALSLRTDRETPEESGD
ncbi:hypothetical protein [Tessaracoccus sp. ZS01]|uniref:hypothetical protein n=1 Tax=Tessaracoccus sp. ZS01 TaxID=1906324 RepID=UPI00096C16E0|nr:hypothetical protein [Tessaracoccus sp. ZS01]MCG6567036.1 hypothetical protein [Tessaracoccus sp. ZS01]OMG57445.1 hypothetical protein BJN44_05265 [Tessaracoccus sp. ZS01]